MATKAINITESQLLKTGTGVLKGLVINSHTSGTIKFVDGLTNGAFATGTLTSSGACVPASHAESVFTSTGVVVAGQTITIGSTVYTARVTPLAPYDVAMGADAAAFLDNLKLAINGTGTAGSNYGVGTVKHPDVVATDNADTTQKIVARLPGLTPNALETTETFTNGSWADTTLGGGTGASNPGVTTAGATFTIGTRAYTAVLQLSETSGADAVADQILWVTSEAVFLDNVKSAINGIGTRGVDYSSNTSVNGDVTATTNTNTAQTFLARKSGTGGNSIATTETLANYAFGGAVLASGTLTEGETLFNTITFSAVATTGERFIDLGGVAFTRGLLAIVGGTADVTVLVD